MDLKTTFVQPDKNSFIWWTGITILVVIISILHYTTPTMNWEYHLILMQSYFIPVLLAAFRFGIRGGLISALLITVFYLPHIMLQWGGFVETNMIRFLQILLFFVIGYMTGFKTEREKEEKEKFQRSASELSANLEKLKRQAEEIGLLEQQLRQVDRLSVIGELTANLAHEVRNPLGSIRGAAEILRSEAPDALKKSEFFQIIFGETDRLNQVVENYLHYARKQNPRKINFNITDILDNVKMLLGRPFDKNGIALNISAPDGPCYICGDPGQFWQVLTNLLINAQQASEKGMQVDLSVQPCDKSEITSAIQVVVQDQGAGLTAEALDKIFQPFYTTKTDGTGLGLPIVKRIAEENNWIIGVESTPGRGTRFSITIPLAGTP